MSLLVFENVSKHYEEGGRDVAVLDGVSFRIERETLVGLFGLRRTGKSTLLRLAAGIETPQQGTVLVAGRDVGALSPLERERLLRRTVGYVAIQDWSPSPNESVADYVALSLGSEGPAMREARRRARAVLDGVGIAECADDRAGSLSLVDRMRAVLARVLIREPALLLVDEPAVIPSLRERDDFCALLRSLARDTGTTLVVASEEMGPLHGAGVLMSISGGELCSTEERGAVVPLPRRNRATAGRRAL